MAGTPDIVNVPPAVVERVAGVTRVQFASPKSPVRAVGGPPENASTKLAPQHNVKNPHSDSFQPLFSIIFLRIAEFERL